MVRIATFQIVADVVLAADRSGCDVPGDGAAIILCVLQDTVLSAGLLPVVTMMGLQFAFMMGGAIVVENIFSWNGVGRMAVEAIFQRDYPVIQGFILTFSIVVVVVAISIDALYAVLDPRIRRS